MERDRRIREKKIAIKEREIAIKEKEAGIKELEESLISKAIQELQKEYPNLDMEDVVKAINLLNSRDKAVLFMQLKGKVRDVWLKHSIGSIQSTVSITNL